ncbi:hypothetical protein K0M31_011160 [Melipona bicolor]|uniref:Uncharacterized protein n=1 Tax=Melipona bicolor TaxID=60889 RepID=A0AA40G906_9HYME|nr:hypothetical protein K0M31_011160 [Melipona bicolor]
MRKTWKDLRWSTRKKRSSKAEEEKGIPPRNQGAKSIFPKSEGKKRIYLESLFIKKKGKEFFERFIGSFFVFVIFAKRLKAQRRKDVLGFHFSPCGTRRMFDNCDSRGDVWYDRL